MTDTAAPESSATLPPGAKIGAGDVIEAAGHPVGGGVIKPGYDPRLTNEDLAPLGKQSWGSYNIFAFWMSDVHSVGGYVTAGSLFALGLATRLQRKYTMVMPTSSAISTCQAARPSANRLPAVT